MEIVRQNDVQTNGDIDLSEKHDDSPEQVDQESVSICKMDVGF